MTRDAPPPQHIAPPAYVVHIVPGYAPNAGHATVGGDDRVPPSYAQHMTHPATTSDPAVVATESRQIKWVVFIVGNLMSVALVIWEISSLNVCFDEYQGDDPDDETVEESAENTRVYIMVTLVSGILIDVMSAIFLSLIYRAPLDVKSVHKIPLGDRRHCGGTFIIHFLAPFSWSLIYIFGGITSMYYGENSLCNDGVEDEDLLNYLEVSGSFMVVFGVGMFFLSGLALFACGAPLKFVEPCFKAIGNGVHRKILSKGVWFDLFWQLQGVILSYRTGAFGVVASVLAGVLGVVGEWMAAVGSFAPDVVQELAGPMA